MNRLLRLYPAVWRYRYGAEFEALLADRPPGIRDRLDIVRGALDARLRPQLGRSDDTPDARVWSPWVVAAAVGGGSLFVVASWSLGTQSTIGVPYRDSSMAQVAIWLGALLLAIGPLRAVSMIGDQSIARLLFPFALFSSLMIVGPWPIFVIAFYLFAVASLVAGIARFKPEGAAWLLVVVGSLGCYVFNTEDARAWLFVPFGLAWVVVGALHLTGRGVRGGGATPGDPLVPAA